MLSILDQSVDFDYLTYGTASYGYDDLDSYSEYIIEKIVGNDSFITENDDDSPVNKSSGKIFPVLYFSHIHFRPYARVRKAPRRQEPIVFGHYAIPMPCSGYLQIFSPPPELA